MNIGVLFYFLCLLAISSGKKCAIEDCKANCSPEKRNNQKDCGPGQDDLPLYCCEKECPVGDCKAICPDTKRNPTKICDAGQDDLPLICCNKPDDDFDDLDDLNDDYEDGLLDLSAGLPGYYRLTDASWFECASMRQMAQFVLAPFVRQQYINILTVGDMELDLTVFVARWGAMLGLNNINVFGTIYETGIAKIDPKDITDRGTPPDFMDALSRNTRTLTSLNGRSQYKVDATSPEELNQIVKTHSDHFKGRRIDIVIANGLDVQQGALGRVTLALQAAQAAYAVLVPRGLFVIGVWCDEKKNTLTNSKQGWNKILEDGFRGNLKKVFSDEPLDMRATPFEIVTVIWHKMAIGDPFMMHMTGGNNRQDIESGEGFKIEAFCKVIAWIVLRKL